MPLRLYRGDSYSWQFRAWADPDKTQAIDLAGAAAAGQLAGPVRGAGGVLELTCSVELPNMIDVQLPASAWSGTLKLERWDLQLSWDDGRVFTLIAGPVTVEADVTP